MPDKSSAGAEPRDTRLAPSARVDENTRIYAIGDIHGRADLLTRMMHLIARDSNAASPVRETILVFVGDYVDRGPNSAGVIDRLLDISRDDRYRVHMLKGNHEVMFLEFLSDSAVLFQWLANGGAATLESYGIDVEAVASGRDGPERLRRAALAAIPEDHLALLDRLEISVEVGDYLFVHAGIRPGVALAHQDEQDMIWIREPFLDHVGDFGKVVIHGHTPVPEPQIRPNRIDIDTLAWRSGKLTALVLEGDRFRFLTT